MVARSNFIPAKLVISHQMTKDYGMLVDLDKAIKTLA